ncbi:MAG: prolyl oligopeptidase family serine peptidase [Myxococcota bacterium]
MILLASLLTVPAEAQERFENPPDDVSTILDARRPPSVSFSPDNTWLVERERPSLPPLAELAEPSLKLAGVKLNPATRGPAREYAYTALTLRKTTARKGRTLEVGEGARIRNFDWDTSSRRFSYTMTRPNGIELWVVDVEDPTPRRLLGPVLNAAYGAPCDWLPGDEGLICKVVPDDQGPAPLPPTVAGGPRVEENLGGKRPARTYQNLLTDAHDEAAFAYYFTSKLVHVALDGTTRTVLEPAIVDEATPSPDGKWLLVDVMHPPWSRSVPASRFPRTIAVHELTTGQRVEVADLPLADDIPTAFGSTRTGRRGIYWRGDEPATLYWAEALDGGDGSVEAEERDQIYQWPAPFAADPAPLWTTALRFSRIMWGDDQLALGVEYWRATRQLRVWQLDPSNPDTKPILHWDRSSQDRYSDPGTPVYETGPYGWGVMRITEDRQLWLSGRGYSPKGVFPFLDRYDVAGQTTERLWQSRDPYYERVVDVMPDGERFITSRQSAKSPPNLFLRRLGRSRAQPLTRFADWAAAFSKVEKKLVKYQREDGVELTATLYLPPGYRRRDGPLPTVFWAYPFEFKRKSDAGQVSSTTNWFTRPGGSSVLFFLLHGYAVVDDPSMPIVGEGEELPNDTFREQLVAGAEAAVQTFVDMGVTDPDRTVIGGHSYGAFMVANLLAHSDLFRAGIARSGAYNRSLTPFGFQGEDRTFWEARDTYMEMSPFTHANAIDEPLLLLHGADDSNSGTYPVQSERLYEAIKGNGGVVRWVVLPHEDHGYRARESVGHALWEMFRWADTYARDADQGQP